MKTFIANLWNWISSFFIFRQFNDDGFIAKRQLRCVCKLGKASAQCRYLDEDEIAKGKFNCVKIQPTLKKIVDTEVKKWEQAGIDDSTAPLGEGCEIKNYSVLLR